MAGSLSQEQIDAYRRDGFLCPIPVFDAAEAQTHRAAYERAERDYENKLPRPVQDYTRTNAHIAFDAPRLVAQDPRILDAVESILGPDLLLWGVEYFTKEANTSKIVSWHQDITYWGMGETDHEVTAWLALSPASEAAGCMKFVPGSHKSAVVDHNDTFDADNLLSRGQEIAVDVDEGDAVAAALQPGEMSLHHGRLIHASGPNTTEDRRIGCVMRFIRPDTPITGHSKDFAMLMRGCDRSQTRINFIPPAGDFTPESLALYEEVIAAQAVALTAGAEQAVGNYQPA
ncbi:MAG: phytanoyl-CoA dioxygenase family protein [Pseudomonadota bacterium]